MLPGLQKALGSILGSGFSGLSDLIKNFKLNPEKAAEFEVQKQELLKELELKRLEIEALVINKTTEEVTAYLADVQNSRAMQIEALKQDDKFSKRFIYYLSIGYLTFAFGFVLCFFFVDFPEKNRDFINMAAGVIVSTGMVMILSFFYGSSKSSKDAHEAIRQQLTGNTPQKN